MVNYESQDRFLEAFFPSEFGEKFYLTGGTALARFYFHHRESLDLDLFTQDQKLDFSIVTRLIKRIGLELNLTISNQVTTDTFMQFIFTEPSGKSGLKIDVVKEVPVHFGEIEIRGKLRLDSLENIGANKVLAVFGRTDAKDFVDLYLLLQKTDFSFDHLFELGRKKDLGLSELFLAHAFSQVVKIEVWPEIKIPFDRKQMIEFYQDLSRKLLLKIKPKE